MRERQINPDNPIFPLRLHLGDPPSRESLWTYLQDASGEMEYPDLLWCFILHCEALPLIPLRNRAIGSQRCNQDLDAHLQGHFLPKLFSLIDSCLAEQNLDLDIDGNVFIAFLGILLSDGALSLPQQLGDSLSQIATLVKPLSDNPPHFDPLRSKFPAQLSRFNPRPLAAVPKKLLPFHHDTFDERFSLIELSSNESEKAIEYGALEFGRDTAFNDKYHWHNTKKHILPKHLGGEQTKPSDEWQRMKMMKGHQRFMARLTADAATLTGALGARFNRLTIVTGRTDEVQGKGTRHPVRFTLTLLLIGRLMMFRRSKGTRNQGRKKSPCHRRRSFSRRLRQRSQSRTWMSNGSGGRSGSKTSLVPIRTKT